MREGGQSSLELEITSWSMLALRAFSALVIAMVGTYGWQLQARYGLSGPRMIELGVLPDLVPRFGGFERIAPSKLGPSRAELARRVALGRAKQLGLGDRRAAGLLLIGVVAPEWSDAAVSGMQSDGSLLWPVRHGEYGRGYGSGQDGYHLAIDIEGERGADVLAAAPGIVGYAGHELRGYGNVIMIVHPGGRVTLYGHNEKNLVVAGERVYQGQAIAELGSTGRSMGPHVHFELKHDGRNCDPMPLMRAADGGSYGWPAFRAASWLPETTRPSAIRCHPRRVHPQADVEVEENLVGTSEGAGEAHSG
jgi:hypothetical protein